MEAVSPARPRASLPLPTRFGRYRLTKLLAVGGMAEIYLAKSFGAEGFVKPLVIKRLDPRLVDNPHFTTLFINEAKLLVTLNHGNIVPVFDFGKVGGDLYIVMEYIAGPSLSKLLKVLERAKTRLDHLLAAHVASEICKGLDYAHRKTDASGRPAGIIHRDIKPKNVLLSLEGEVKIVDFGVAKLATRERDAHLAGTLAYMSPEQARQQAVDQRTDIFSTGLVLYEMLAHRQANDASDPITQLEHARNAEVPPLPDTVPRELREVVRRATQRDAAARYRSAHEMEQDLAEYLLLSRSAGASLDTVSPASKLSKLIRTTPDLQQADRESDVDTLDEPLAPDDGIEVVAEGESQSLLGSGDPVDLALLQNAAETFHSEFLTRVLAEYQEGPKRRRWLWALPVAAVGSLALAAFWLYSDAARDGPPRAATAAVTPPVAASPSAAASAPPATATDRALPITIRTPSVDAAGERPGATPADAAATTRPRKTARRRPSHRRPTRPRRPPRQRTTKTPVDAAFGYLNLNSIPWSRVTIDGQPLPRPTPILKLRLAAGPHTIVLRNDERRLKRTVRVRIRPGETTWKVVRLTD